MTINSMKATLLSFVIALLAACGNSHEEDARLLIEVFKGKNPGINIRKYKLKSFLDGTVPARSVGYAEDSRLKATLGCFDWVYSMPGDPSETDSHMCIYLVVGPEGGGAKVWWRGDTQWLKGLMKEQAFKS